MDAKKVAALEEDRRCRICYDEETPDDPLLSPCRCKGSVAFLHQSCLNHWIRQSRATRCEMCKKKYRKSRKFRRPPLREVASTLYQELVQLNESLEGIAILRSSDICFCFSILLALFLYILLVCNVIIEKPLAEMFMFSGSMLFICFVLCYSFPRFGLTWPWLLQVYPPWWLAIWTWEILMWILGLFILMGPTPLWTTLWGTFAVWAATPILCCIAGAAPAVYSRVFYEEKILNFTDSVNVGHDDSDDD